MGIYMKINELIKTYDRIFIDASTLLSHSGQFLLNELSLYDINDFNGANHIIISNETAFKVQKDPGTTKVHYLLKSLQKLHKDKIVQFRNFENQPYSIIFDKFIQRYSLALITNDATIAENVLDYTYTQNSKPYGVFSLNNKIQLDSYEKKAYFSYFEKKLPSRLNTKQKRTQVKPQSTQLNSQKTMEKKPEMTLLDEGAFEDLRPLSENPFSKKYLKNPVKFKGIEKHDIKLNHEIPKVNDVLTSSMNRPVELTSLLSSKGGEGIIYYTNIKGYVCKIYRKESLSAHKLEKLELLVSKPLDDPRIAYPKELVYFKGKFVGYIMPYVNGDFVGDFFLGLLSVRKFNNWNRMDLIVLALSILTLVKKAHSHGVLIGDVNRNNFMIESPKRVYMVDVDSAQIEKYPCPVGVEEFTPPEIIDGEHSYREFFRTYENEYYSIAVLLFMILMLGTQTTAQVSNESTSKVEKIKRQKFGFTLDEEETKANQNIVNFAVWSRFPSYIKEAFYHTFQKSGKYNKPSSRLNIDQWIELLNSYKYHLSAGLLGDGNTDFRELITKDPVSFNSVQLQPARFVDYKISAFTLDALIKNLVKTLKDYNYKNIDNINKDLIDHGYIDQNYIKLKISSNLGFMYQLKGLLYMNGGK